jgi:spermidine/putrescine transport system ATP-binding protein
MQELLSIKSIYKEYEGKNLLCGVDLSVHEGEILCLLGSSGSGKSTLLRIIAGLEKAEKGQILWQKEPIDDIPVHLRNFGLMFQEYALFPHLDVFSNIAFGLRMRTLAEDKIALRVKQVLRLVGMSSFEARRVSDLSGGEQQRIALARALAPEPRLMMLDEPLGALDKKMKDELSRELRTLLHQLRIPSIYVTHDQQEAFNIADRLAVLHEGRIHQQGTAREILSFPRSLWLAGFLGLDNQLQGVVQKTSPLQVMTSQGLFHCRQFGQPLVKGQKVVLVLKPDHSKPIKGDVNQNAVTGRVTDVTFQSDGFHIQVAVGKSHFISFFSRQQQAIGENIQIHYPADSVLCYAK